ncbi:MAG: DUF4276 family protein [Desulfomonilaceae bacterium]
MKISLIIEGKTEKAFLPVLRGFLKDRLVDRMPTIDVVPQKGRIPTDDKLRRVVANLLTGPQASDYVIALTDVYTGTQPPDFRDAAHAKSKMREWVGNEPRFRPHAAQYDFEAWLLPYWPTIQRLAGHNRRAPGGNPETVNHNNPPAHRIKEIFEPGTCRDSYVKPRDALRILKDNNLSEAVNQCEELKALVNTILFLSGGATIQ